VEDEAGGTHTIRARLNLACFRRVWNLSNCHFSTSRTIRKYQKTFVFSAYWIDRNPARMVKNPKTRDSGDGRNEQKLPFTDEEIKRMYDSCPKYGTDYHQMDRRRSGRFHLPFDLYRTSHFRRCPVSSRPNATDRRTPHSHYQSRDARLYLGAGVASGTHLRIEPRSTAIYFWSAPSNDPRHHHRDVAPKVERAMGVVW
jgi:hypothetical protein